MYDPEPRDPEPEERTDSTAAMDLEMWTIYMNPSDHPGQFVARKFVIGSGSYVPTEDMMIDPSITPIRNAMEEKGLVRIVRDRDDDPVILEVWL